MCCLFCVGISYTWTDSLEAGGSALGLRESGEEEADVAAFTVRVMRIIRILVLIFTTIDNH